jgi:hypothetical protein
LTLLLTAFALLTGTGKSISVCGINSALVARPSAGASRFGMAGYFVGLGIGALLLSVAIVTGGHYVFGLAPFGATDRRLVAGILVLGIGALETVHGAWLLPHLQWAVPRSWSHALRSDPFLLIFGLIRGVAIFNHSPFASMHALILVLFLLPEVTSPLVTAFALALGLVAWSVAIAALRILDPVRKDQLLLSLTGRSLAATKQLGRLDGVALVAVGSAFLFAGL